MAIHYHCRCGADIKLPDTMAGQPSKCQVCNWLFTVPGHPCREDEDTPLVLKEGEWVEQPRQRPEQPGQRAPYYSVELGCWITTGGNEEYLPRSSEHPPELLKVEGEEELPEKRATYPPPIVLDEPDKAPVPRYFPPRPQPPEAEKKSFWRDLVDSFVFFMDSGNLITFMMIVVISLVLEAVNFIPGINLMMSFLMLVMQLAFAGFVFSFFLSVIRETASGADDLPQIVWINDWLDDLIRPMLHFLLTWLMVLLPAFLALVKMRMDDAVIDWRIIGLLAAVGVFFWPALILAVSIGGGVVGIWPHTIIRTAVSAPLAYLAVWLVVLVAFGISVLAQSSWLYAGLIKIAPQNPFKAVMLLSIVSGTLNVYAMIVAMRAIGLFYRHFKNRFPWRAE